MRAADRAECPLLAKSGHLPDEFQCPLLGVKRTSLASPAMSVVDPNRTLLPRNSKASNLPARESQTTDLFRHLHSISVQESVVE